MVCRGFSGYNSRWWNIILPKLLNAKDVEDAALVTLFLGANDSVLSDLGKAQHVPLEEFQQNMSDMVVYLQVKCTLKKFMQKFSLNLTFFLALFNIYL